MVVGGGLTEPRISGYTLYFRIKISFCAFEAGDIVCWLVNPPIAKLDLFNSADCRWICKTYAEYRYRNSATVRRLVQSLTLQSTICCWWPSDLRGSIRVSPAWLSPASSEAGNELLGWTATKWRFVTASKLCGRRTVSFNSKRYSTKAIVL